MPELPRPSYGRLMETAARSLAAALHPELRPVDRCEVCGRFVGRYPVGFCCDRHCSRCVCTRCPGFREAPHA